MLQTSRTIDGIMTASDPLERPEAPDRALAAAETLARWLDHRFVDPLLGLVLPGVGDLLA